MTREDAMQQLAQSTDFEFRYGKVVVRRVGLIDRIDQIDRRESDAGRHRVPLASSLGSTASRAA
ncbi:MAG: hypothetical protein H0U69_10800 [Trueperaceae bacterium]|nr:hypothetical protein [Trueperaceae bacterium]